MNVGHSEAWEASRAPAPQGLLPEPAERMGAHGYAGKRVRHDVADGVALVAFSLAASASLALVFTLAPRFMG